MNCPASLWYAQPVHYWGLDQFGVTGMKRRLPGRYELAVLAILALLVAALRLGMPEREELLILVSFPLLLGSMLLGAWRSGRLDPPPSPTLRPDELEV